MVTFVTFHKVALVQAPRSTEFSIGVFRTFEEAARYAMEQTAEYGHLMVVAKVLALTEREVPVAPKVSIVNVCDLEDGK